MIVKTLPDVFDASWTLFLDRDGVINQRPIGDYVRSINEFIWLPGAVEAIVKLSDIFGKIVIVTNQQGVGLGLMTQQELDHIHNYLCAHIQRAGGRIDAVFSCTMLRAQANNCRKPGLALAHQAKTRFPEIDFKKSLMVGDTESDIVFGRNAGMITVKVGNEPTTVSPDFRFGSLFQFFQHLAHSQN